MVLLGEKGISEYAHWHQRTKPPRRCLRTSSGAAGSVSFAPTDAASMRRDDPLAQSSGAAGRVRPLGQRQRGEALRLGDSLYLDRYGIHGLNEVCHVLAQCVRILAREAGLERSFA